MLRDEPTWAYDTAGDLDTPSGPRNTGYVHATTSPAAQWARGELPMDGVCGFGLCPPSVMREPGTSAGIARLADRSVVVSLGD